MQPETVPTKNWDIPADGSTHDDSLLGCLLIGALAGVGAKTGLLTSELRLLHRLGRGTEAAPLLARLSESGFSDPVFALPEKP